MPITKTKSEAGLLVLIVFVLGVLVGGLGNHVWGQRVWGMRNTRPARVDFMTEFTKRLDLTATQQTQVKAVADDVSRQWKELYAPVDHKRDEIRAQGREKIRALLTPEQQPKFDELIRERDAARLQQQQGH
jgi:Spy/CpxP family protein refolding chaperone